MPKVYTPSSEDVHFLSRRDKFRAPKTFLNRRWCPKIRVVPWNFTVFYPWIYFCQRKKSHALKKEHTPKKLEADLPWTSRFHGKLWTKCTPKKQSVWSLNSTEINPRSTEIHDPRSTINNPRSTIHDPRSTIHDPRKSTIHDPRSTIHASTERCNK